MKRFEVGESYDAVDSGVDPIRIIKRTAKTVYVTNGTNEWRMLIRTDIHGDEFVIDSSVPLKWRGMFTYAAALRVGRG